MAENSIKTNYDLLTALRNNNAPKELVDIVDKVENDKQIPKDFKLNLSLGLISFNDKSQEYYDFITSLEGGMDILSKQARLGNDSKFWNWKPKQIAALLGYESPEALMDPENGWKKTLSPEMIKEIATTQGIDYDQLMMWLEGHQESMDRQREYKKGKYLPERFFMPRTWESHAAGKEASGKDIAMDVGENLAYLVPTSRLVGMGTKFIATPGIRSGLRTGIGAAIVPTSSVVADRTLYDDAENYKRANRGFGDVLEGTATNIAIPRALTMGGKRFARWWSGDKPTKAVELGEALSFDPYISAQEFKLRSKHGVPVTTDPELSKELVTRDILKKTYPTYKKGIKTEGPKQRKEIEAEAALKPEIQEDYADVLGQYNLIPDEDISNQFKNWYTVSNREEVLPTRALGSKAGLYGSKDGHLVYINDRAAEKLPMGSDHNLINPVAPSKYSANAQRMQDMSTKTAKMYPHKTDFDKIYLEAINDPKYADVLTGHGDLLNNLAVSGTTYLGNKAGETKMGSAAAKAILGTVGIDVDADFKDQEAEEIIGYLQDDAMIRMWKDGNFKPHGKPSDPIVKAYNIWAKNNNKELIK